MSVLLDRSNAVVIQGITGKMGRFAARDLQAYGTRVVAGTAPGRGGSDVEGVPVFETVARAVREKGADTALVFVPAPAALDAVLEALDAGCRMIVYPGDGLPVVDAIEMRAAARRCGAVVVGPNSPGVISPGSAKLGFMPSSCFAPGALGVISRSGSLSYEVCKRLTTAGLGQTTVIGIGGDPVKGLTAAEAAALLHADPQTRGIVYLGEIGGSDEYDVAAYAAQAGAKPVAALLVGRSAPPERKMGHAGALISSRRDTHEAKMHALRGGGVHATATLAELVPLVRAMLRAPSADQPQRTVTEEGTPTP